MSKTQEYFQKTFLKGMNQQIDPTRLQGDSYFLLSNARVRRDVVEPVKKVNDLSSISPQASIKYQGLYSAGSFAILFADGKAYIKNFEDATTGFSTVQGFSLDPNADFVYGALVPASTMDYIRVFSSSDSVVATDYSQKNNVLFKQTQGSFVVAGSKAVGVFQDGLRQAYAITTDGNAFLTQNYDQWNEDRREYVPVGKQMVDVGGIFYVASPDGRTLYRSVTGRPLDFVIAIDNTGAKVSDAGNTSLKVSYNPITCLYPTGDAIFVGAKEGSSLLVRDDSRVVYGEPLFKKQFLFESGPLNQVSIVDLNGDLGFIDYGGIRSFNSTKQLNIESNNTPLSAPVAKLFAGVTQSTTCCGDFDDYAFFACNTIYGFGVLVYDKTLEQFVSFDQYSGVTGAIKQFAVVRTSTGRRLLFITTDNKMYEAFAGVGTEPVKMYIGEWCTNNPAVEQKTVNLNCVFLDAQTGGTFTATLFVDRKRIASKTETIDASISGITNPQTMPFGDTDNDAVQNIGMNFNKDAANGWKIGFMLEWDCNANLSHLRVESETRVQRSSSLGQQAKRISSNDN